MQLIRRDVQLDMEVWAHFDNSAEVWELFASSDGSDYLGCCDDLAECMAFAKDRFAEARDETLPQ